MLDKVISYEEILMMGLRLNEGIEIERLKILNLNRKNIFKQLLRKKMIKIRNDKIMVENNYLIKLNTILSKIMSNH